MAMANRQNIAYLSDLGDTATVPQEVVSGNVVTFGTERGELADSGKKPADFAAATALTSHEQDAVAHLSSEEHENLTEQQSAFGLSFKGVSYDSTNKKIVFTRQDDTTTDFDATAFIKDGMVSNVEISGANLVVTFNTDSGKEPIIIPLAGIFNPSNYYDKTAADDKFVEKVSGKGLSTNDFTNAEKTKLSGVEDGAQVNPVASDANPEMDGTASAGSSRNYSRADHVHPSDDTKFSKSGGQVDGNVSIRGGQLSLSQSNSDKDYVDIILTLYSGALHSGDDHWEIVMPNPPDGEDAPRFRIRIPRISHDAYDIENPPEEVIDTLALLSQVNKKQNVLAFDDTPTDNSDNPVKSSGIKTAIDAKYTKPQDGIPKGDLVQSVRDTIDSVSEKRNKDEFSVDNENWVFTDADGNVVCLKPSGVDFWTEDRDDPSEGGWSLQWSSRNSFWVLEYESGGIPDSYTSYDSGSSSVLTFDVDGVDVRVVKGYRIAFDTEIEELKKKLSQMESRLTSLMSGGIYVKEEGANVFHKLVAVKDAETGKVDIGIDQEEGVLQ